MVAFFVFGDYSIDAKTLPYLTILSSQRATDNRKLKRLDPQEKEASKAPI
jgi:hypothetical protein